MRHVLDRILAISFALALTGSAFAADMVTKAAPPINFGPYPTSGGGFYYGLNVLGSATSIVNSTAPGAVAVGGDVGGLVGYVDVISPSSFWFAEGIFDFQNLNGGTAGLSLTGPAHLEQRVGFGSPLNTMLGSLIGNSNLPTVPGIPLLPAGITAGPQNGYLYAALNEDDVSASIGAASGHEWLVAPEFGVGMQSRLSNSVVADMWGGVKVGTQGLCIGAIACPKLGVGPVAGVSFKY